MKELKLPNRSAKQREEIYNSIQSGDKLYKVQYNAFNKVPYIITLTVIKRTLGNKLRLNNGELINHLPQDIYIEDEDFKNYLDDLTLEEKLYGISHKFKKHFKEVSSEISKEETLQLIKILYPHLKEKKY